MRVLRSVTRSNRSKPRYAEPPEPATASASQATVTLEPPALMTVAEAAAFMRVAVKTLYGWSAARKVPSLRARGRLLFQRDKLLDWMRGEERS